MKDEVTWQHWRKIDNHITLTNITSTFYDLISELEANLPSFKADFYVKRAQQTYFEEIKPSEIVIQVDFAENYRFANQNEIQSAHFNYRQVSIFTCVAWLHKNQNRLLS